MNTNENSPTTVRDAVETVIKDLSEVAVPISQMESIGFPIARSINILKNVCNSWDAEEEEKARKAQQKAPEESEVKLELVKEDAPEEEQNNG